MCEQLKTVLAVRRAAGVSLYVGCYGTKKLLAVGAAHDVSLRALDCDHYSLR